MEDGPGNRKCHLIAASQVSSPQASASCENGLGKGKPSPGPQGPRTDTLLPSLIERHILSAFIKYLSSARHCDGCWDIGTDRTDKAWVRYWKGEKSARGGGVVGRGTWGLAGRGKEHIQSSKECIQETEKNSLCQDLKTAEFTYSLHKHFLN